MTGCGESGSGRHLFYESRHPSFLICCGDDIEHGAALYADEVMVVAREPLGELEADHAVGSVMRCEDAGVGEDGQRSIEG